MRATGAGLPPPLPPSPVLRQQPVQYAHQLGDEAAATVIWAQLLFGLLADQILQIVAAGAHHPFPHSAGMQKLPLLQP
ncbi:MAG: hypothetical protein R3F38_18930 [Gammaproteobacteria bacterium]